MDKIIWMHLLQLGVPANLAGYHMLKSAIKLVYEGPKPMMSLYEELAVEYNTSTSCVERNIRYVVRCVFDNTRPEVLREYFGNTCGLGSGKLTNAQFIYGVAEYIKAVETVYEGSEL